MLLLALICLKITFHQTLNGLKQIFQFPFFLVSAEVTYIVSPYLQGFSATSQETGTTVLSGLPGANPNGSARAEGGICNARIHTVWVRTVKHLSTMYLFFTY